MDFLDLQSSELDQAGTGRLDKHAPMEPSMLKRMSRRTKRGIIVTLVTFCAAALAAVPLQAMADELPQANLDLTLLGFGPGGDGSGLVSVRVTNHGPDDVPISDYAVMFDWSGSSNTSLHPDDTRCQLISGTESCLLLSSKNLRYDAETPLGEFKDTETFSIRLVGNVRTGPILMSIVSFNYEETESEGANVQFINLPT